MEYCIWCVLSKKVSHLQCCLVILLLETYVDKQKTLVSMCLLCFYGLRHTNQGISSVLKQNTHGQLSALRFSLSSTKPSVVPSICHRLAADGSPPQQQLHNTFTARRGSKKQTAAKRSANTRDGRRQPPTRPHTDSFPLLLPFSLLFFIPILLVLLVFFQVLIFFSVFLHH